MERGHQIIDISPVISGRTAVFPGDQAFERKIAMDFSKGDSLALSSIHSTVHIGAHADAPNHYHPHGTSIDRRALDLYFGPCQVISVSLPQSQRIRPEDLRGIEIRAPRVLFRTLSFPNPESWNGDFNSLSPELVHWLADRKVVLAGIDTPSVDPADSKRLESHQAIFERDLAILEGIVLEQVADGLYLLIALPLKIADADASPVRAVLVKDFWGDREKR